jgi:thiamine phosphate synthase YjbQ (UPF0047 family)
LAYLSHRSLGDRKGFCCKRENDDERGHHQDYNDWLEELAPHEPIGRYRHNRTGEACPE